MGGAESGAWRRNSYMSQMLAFLALATPAVAYYDGSRGMLALLALATPTVMAYKPRTRLEAVDVTRWFA